MGDWGSDVKMTPTVVAVRQNLSLLVNHGQPVPGLNANDTSQWGNTLGNASFGYVTGTQGTGSGVNGTGGGRAFQLGVKASF